MKILLLIFTALSAIATTAAFSIDSNPQSTRRHWLATSLAAPVAALALPLAANAQEKLETFHDEQHGFSLSIPASWAKTEQELSDRRKIVIWADPSNPKTALFIAYTPVRDDFTSLASFGAVDQVAAQTILPKGEFAGQVGVKAEMLRAESKKQAYIFDYTQEIENVQPQTHFRTIFTLQQGATGGAGAVLVTITLQTPEERYSTVQPVFDSVIDSYGKSA